jgi:NAD(P)-dependent dehydrogenase (short-subunit alcohol dehydrogenase family)
MTLPTKKVVFINGAGQGIGKGMAEGMAEAEGDLVVYTIAKPALSGDVWRRRRTADGRMHFTNGAARPGLIGMT